MGGISPPPPRGWFCSGSSRCRLGDAGRAAVPGPLSLPAAQGEPGSYTGAVLEIATPEPTLPLAGLELGQELMAPVRRTGKE